jgi:hypothetical protein
VAVLPVLFGMLWRGELAADLEDQPLCPATLVRARDAPRAAALPAGAAAGPAR